MDRYSVLGKRIRELEKSELFQDLNLDQLVEAMCEEEPSAEEEIRKYCMQMPEDLETVRYRQQMMQALDEPALEEAFRRFVQDMRKAIEQEEIAAALESGDSRAHWHLAAAYIYFRAMDHLMETLESRVEDESDEEEADESEEGTKRQDEPSMERREPLPLLPEGFRDLLSACREFTAEPEYMKNHDRAIQTYEQMAELRYSLHIEGDHVRILPRLQEDDAIKELRQRFPMHVEMPERLPRLLPGNKGSTKLEQSIFNYLRRKNPRPFKEMRLFAAECQDFFSDTVLQLFREISFYLAYLRFRHYMEDSGYSFCYPEFQDSGMEVTDGYDLALACKNQPLGKSTIPNDYYFEGKERFFVVTGANQGGKTTFGRSVGQLIYFANMGFPVPAKKAKLPYFSGIVTHFSVEESMESGRGKLKEELVRLAPIMHGKQKGAFVVINELFTSAATYDAYQMGRRVMEHFLAQDCYGIYVTHIEEMAKEQDGIVSLTASLAEGGGYVRTYKIVRKAAGGKGYVETIVDQYGLSYDEIVRRLKK